MEYITDMDGTPRLYGMNQGVAFTVAELGLMLPDDTRSYRLENCWQIYYADGDSGMNLFIPEDVDTEAHARAGFLIYLLETNGITAEEVNKRLSYEL